MAVKRQKQPMTKNKMTVMIVAAVAVVVALCVLIGGTGKNNKKDSEVDNQTSQQPETPDDDMTPDGSSEEPEPWEEGPQMEPDFGEASEVLETDATYKNDKVLTYTYNEAGDSISLGANLSKNGDLLYLNPVTSVATVEEPVGFILVPDRCYLQYANANFMAATQGDNAGKANFVIQDTYDSVVPSEYQNDKAYGVGWANDILYDGKQQEGTTIEIRVIILRTGKLLTLARAEIDFNERTGSYELRSLRSADVRDNGEMSEEERTALVNNAFSIALNKYYGPKDPELTEEWRESAVAGAFVEKVSSMYFDKCMDVQDNLKYSDAVSSGLTDIYAVSIPYPDGAFMTMYFSPQAKEIIPNIPKEISNKIDQELVLQELPTPNNYFGRDIYQPLSKTSPYTPYGFYS